MSNRNRRNVTRRAANIAARIANLPPRPPPPPSHRGDDLFTGEEDVELFHIHNHPPEADISRAGLEAYLNSVKLDYLNKNAIQCYHRPRPLEPDSHLNCHQLLTAPLIRSIVRNQFYADFMNPKYIEVDPRMTTLFQNIDSVIIPDAKTTNRAGFGDIYGCGICPFCLQITCREEGCAYLTHRPNGMTDQPRCDPRLQNHDLFLEYRRVAKRAISRVYGGDFAEDHIKIEFCVECGRPSTNHMHFSIPKPNEPLRLLRQAPAGICTGGGRKELFARVLAMRHVFRQGNHRHAVAERRECARIANTLAGDPEWLAKGEQALKRAQEGATGDAVWGDEPLERVNYESTTLNQVENHPYRANVNHVANGNHQHANANENENENENDNENAQMVEAQIMDMIQRGADPEAILAFVGEEYRALVQELLHREDMRMQEQVIQRERFVQRLRRAIAAHPEPTEYAAKAIVDELEQFYWSGHRIAEMFAQVDFRFDNNDNADDELRNLFMAEVTSRVEREKIEGKIDPYRHEYDPIRADHVLMQLIDREGIMPEMLETIIEDLRRKNGLPVENGWNENGDRRPYEMLWHRLKFMEQNPDEFRAQPPEQMGKLIGKVFFSLIMERRGNLREDAIHLARKFSLLGWIGLTMILEKISIMKARGIIEVQADLDQIIPRYMQILEEINHDPLWRTAPFDDDELLPEIMLFLIFYAEEVEGVITSMERHGVPPAKILQAAQALKALAERRHLNFMMRDIGYAEEFAEEAVRDAQQNGGKRRRKGRKTRKGRKGRKGRKAQTKRR